MRRCFEVLLLALILSPIGFAADESFVWPPLKGIDSVSGRPATEADVQVGRAAFLLQAQDGVSSGTPLRILIPQYAFHVDEESNEKTAVIVIQAEELQGQQIVAAMDVESGHALVGLLREFEFLGAVAPN